MGSAMIKVTVAKSETRDLSGVSKLSGKPYAMRIQSAYAHVHERDGSLAFAPEKFEVILDKDAAPFAPGEYTLHPSALYVDDKGRLQCAPRLTPIKRAA